jgi:hypothetical protein
VELAWLRVHDLGSQAEIRAIPGLRRLVAPGLYPIVEVPLRKEARLKLSFRQDGNVEDISELLPPTLDTAAAPWS